MAALKNKIDFALVLLREMQIPMGILWMEIVQELHIVGWERFRMSA